MVDVVHFVLKKDAPLLQIADACAFGIRRFLSGQSQGPEFARSILGRDLVPEDWAGPGSGGMTHWNLQTLMPVDVVYGGWDPIAIAGAN